MNEQKRQIIVTGGRQGGKSRKMALQMEEIMDKNHNAMVCLAKGDGTFEFFENAEYEDVTVKKIDK